MLIVFGILLITIHSFIEDGSYASQITLSEIKTENCVTKCKSFLLEGVDRYVCAGEANFSGLDAHLIRIQRKRNTKFETICFIDTHECDDNHMCYCKNKTPDTFEYVVNDTASIDDSNATMQASIMSRNGEIIFSEARQLPHVFKSQKIDNFFVSVNGQELKNETCQIYVSKDDSTLDLRFYCSAKQQLESTENICYLYIEYQGDETIYKQQSVKHNFQLNAIQTGSNINFKLKICQEEKLFSCRLNEDHSKLKLLGEYQQGHSNNSAFDVIKASLPPPSSQVDESNFNTTSVVLLVTLVIVSIICMIIIVILILKKVRHNRKDNIHVSPEKMSCHKSTNSTYTNKIQEGDPFI